MLNAQLQEQEFKKKNYLHVRKVDELLPFLWTADLTSQMPENRTQPCTSRFFSFLGGRHSYNIPDKREYTCRNINTEQLGLLRIL